MNRSIFFSVVIGVVCGIISTHVLLIGWGNVIFWGLVGVVLGFRLTDRNAIIANGTAYGFSMLMSFLLSGFQGTSEKLPGFLIFSLALSIIGAVGGIISAWIGFWFRKHTSLCSNH